MFGIEFNSLILLAVAIMNAITLYYTRRTEKNTNSLTTALVKTTKIAAHAAGVKEEREKNDESSGETRK